MLYCFKAHVRPSLHMHAKEVFYNGRHFVCKLHDKSQDRVVDLRQVKGQVMASSVGHGTRPKHITCAELPHGPTSSLGHPGTCDLSRQLGYPSKKFFRAKCGLC